MKPFALALTAALLLPAAARGACLDEDIELAKEFDALIVTYRGGADETVATWMAWNAKKQSSAVALAAGPCDPIRPWPDQWLKSAAMLLTDAGERLLDTHDVQGAVTQFEMAVRFFRHPGAALGDFPGCWFEAVATDLRRTGHVASADALLAKARVFMEHDPRVAYQSGITAEQYAIAAANAVDVLSATSPIARTRSWRPLSDVDRGDTDRAQQRRDRALTDAERWLRIAAPVSDQAALHLARVLMLRGKEAEALKVSESVLQRTSDAATAYLAALLSGAAHEKTGALADAATSYRTAVERYPHGQHAYVALAEVLLRSGRYEDARAQTDAIVSAPPGTPPMREPWWVFTSDMAATDADLFVELRAEARR